MFILIFAITHQGRCAYFSDEETGPERSDNFQGHRASEQNSQKRSSHHPLPPLPPDCTLHGVEESHICSSCRYPGTQLLLSKQQVLSSHLLNESAKIQIQVWALKSMLLPLHQLNARDTCGYKVWCVFTCSCETPPLAIPIKRVSLWLFIIMVVR